MFPYIDFLQADAIYERDFVLLNECLVRGCLYSRIDELLDIP